VDEPAPRDAPFVQNRSTLSILYTLTRRAVAYMTTMPAVSPPKFEPERTGILERSESFRRRRVTSYIT
jgi:hypothetical protein